MEKYYGMRREVEGKKPEPKAKKPSDRLVGEKVELRLIDGGRLQGTLKEAGKYELVLEGKDGEIVVFKHAVAHIIPLKGVWREMA
jgi:sRNA-binding regulator protein Hfq